MKRFSLITLTLIFSVFCLNAQDKQWTLEDCIEYAISNNLSLKRQRLETEISHVNLTRSELDLAPSLNIGSDGRVGFGRSIDPVTNSITFKQNVSNSYYITSGLKLFNGFTALNTISANKYLMQAGLQAEEVTKNTMIIDILGQYYQVIYTKGLENSAKAQLESSEKQLFRIQKLVETGREALSKEYEMESQVSSDRLSYTLALNNNSLALTTLRQMLQLDPATPFDIVVPDLNNILITNEELRADSIYTIAASTLPYLKAIEFELKAAKKQIAAAWGYYFPSISVTGQIYTGFYKVFGGDVGEQDAFKTQLKNNNSQAVLLSLQIPIFNNYIATKNVKLAKISRNDAMLRLQLQKNTLYTAVENVCLNYNRGKDEYKAAAANYTFNKKSFEGVEKKFESGLIDVTIYSTAMTALFKAETDALRTKLQLVIRKLIIQFYTTSNYQNLSI